MKNRFTTLLQLTALLMVISCSSTEKERTVAVEQTPNELPEIQDSPFEKYSDKISEELFFFLRQNAVNVDQNTFIKTEEINLTGDQFVYRVSYLDRGLLAKDGDMFREIPKVYASMGIVSQQAGNEVGNEMIIRGSLEVADKKSGGGESNLSSLSIAIRADIETSYMQSTPYGYSENELVNETYEYESELLVKLNEPRIYNKETLYLKARIMELDASDISILDKAELSYFRNEIFARHGHTFKTSKMIEYFDSKTWYMPLFDDATPYLNETEKNNALFIKTLES